MWKYSLHLNIIFIRSLKIYIENVTDKINYLLLCREAYKFLQVIHKITNLD